MSPAHHHAKGGNPMSGWRIGRSCLLVPLMSGSLYVTSHVFRSVLLARLREWLVAMVLLQQVLRPAPHTLLSSCFTFDRERNSFWVSAGDPVELTR